MSRHGDFLHTQPGMVEENTREVIKEEVAGLKCFGCNKQGLVKHFLHPMEVAAHAQESGG